MTMQKGYRLTLLAAGCILLVPQTAAFVLLNNKWAANMIIAVVEALILPALLLMAACVLSGMAAFEFFRPSIKSIPARVFASIVAAVFCGVSVPVMLVCQFLRERKHVSLLLLIVTYAIGLLTLFGFMPMAWHGLCLGFLPIVVPYLLFAATILTATQARPLARTLIALSPAIVWMALAVVLHLQYLHHKAENMALRREVSELVGFSVFQEDYRKYVASGIGSDEEPLASFMKARFTMPEELEENDYIIRPGTISFLGQDRIDSLAAALAEANPGYEEAVLAFTAIRPGKIAHQHDWGNRPAIAMLLPELSKLRDAARFLELQVRLAPWNRELLVRNNDAMAALRDCALQGETLISVLVGIAIENFRVETLALSIPHMEHPADEWEALLGDEPDLNRAVANAFAYELSFGENAKDYLFNNMWKGVEDEYVSEILGPDINPRIIPRNLFTYLVEIDNGIALGYFRRMIPLILATPLDLAKVREAGDDTRQVAESRVGIFAAMLPVLDRTVEKIPKTSDLRRMASLCRLAFEYRSENGAFPEDAAVLSDDCLDSIHHAPFLLEPDYTFPKPASYDTESNGFSFTMSDNFVIDSETDDDETPDLDESGEEEAKAEEVADDEPDSFRYFRISVQDPVPADDFSYSHMSTEILILYPVEE